MVFSSVTFLFYFLPLTLLAYYFARYRNFILLIASLLFYSWGEIDYLFLLMASCVVNYFLGLMIEKNGLLLQKFLLQPAFQSIF